LETIFIISHESFSKSMYERFSLSTFVENNYKIIFYDLSEIFYENKSNDFEVSSLKIIRLNKKNYISYLNSNIAINSIVFCLLEFNFKTFYIYFLLKIKNVFLIYYNAYYTPFPINASLTSRLKVFISPFNIKRRITVLVLAITKKLTGCGVYDLEFMCNIKSNTAKKYVTINHPDIETVRSITSPIQNKNYIVFIDEMFPSHPDFKHLADYIKINKSDEFDFNSQLYDFLSNISDIQKVDIYIAKHPRRVGCVFESSKFFEFQDKTHELIKYSSGVILSQSASIGIAVYCKKPIVLLDSFLYPKYLRSRIDFFSKELNIKPVGLDCTPIFPNIDITQYDNYLNKYLPFSEKTNSEIILSELLNRNKQIL